MTITKVVLMPALLLATMSVSHASAENSYNDIIYPWYSAKTNCGAASGAVGNDSVYVLGDSLTVGMRDAGQLNQKLTAKGWSVAGIQATSGDQLSDAFPKMQNDINGFKASNKQVGTFVIALGTNKDGIPLFNQLLTQTVGAIKTFNPSAKIFWMNAYTKAANYDDINGAIAAQAPSLGYSIIDWKTEATTKPASYQFAGDGIHHTGAGYLAKADYLVNNIGTPVAGVSATPTAGGTATKTVGEFVDKYGQLAFNTGKKYGIPYEAILSQAIIESGYGKSKLTVDANNFFGIKAGSSWTGPVWTGATREETSGGSSYTISAAFRSYASPQAGFDGYGEFIRGNKRYSTALNFPGDPYRYIQEIKNAGYATDGQYVATNSRMVAQVTQYIQSKNLFTPSSQVVPDAAPPAPGSSSSSDSSASPTANCSTSNTSPSGAGQTAVPTGSNKEIGKQMADQRGWSGAEWTCLEKLWDRESSWKETSKNPKSSAYGIPQALLKTHQANIDANYKGYYEGSVSNPSGGKPDIQIKWGLDYIKTAYQTPCRAWSHSEARGWY